MKRIGLTQRVEYLADRKEYRDCLDQAWFQLLNPLGILPVPISNQTEDVAGLISELKFEGIILTGGNDLAYLTNAVNASPLRDKLENEILKECSKKDIPVLGVCRGLQMMNVHYGGELARVENHVAKPHSLKVVQSGIMPLTNREQINSFHNYGILFPKVGKDLVVVATAPDGSVEAVAHKKYSQWAIMWHPERAPIDPENSTIIKTLFKI